MAIVSTGNNQLMQAKIFQLQSYALFNFISYRKTKILLTNFRDAKKSNPLNKVHSNYVKIIRYSVKSQAKDEFVRGDIPPTDTGEYEKCLDGQ